MDVQKGLYWHQGVFLQPQHFQLQDFSILKRLHLLQSYGMKHFWGVSKMVINAAALANERFEITSGEFFFDDGAFVSIPGTAVSLSRAFTGVWTETEKPLDVYLGLRRFNPDGVNVTEASSPDEVRVADTRYVTGKDPEEIPDMHTGGTPAQIKRLEHALKIFFEPERERMGDYHVIRLARLVRSGDKILLSGAYVPPCVSLSASEALSGLVQEIRDLSAVRCRVLEQYKSPHASRRTGSDLGYMVYLLALMTLNRHLPALIHFRTVEMVHPWEVYGALRQFLGELSTFSTTVNASGEARDGTVLLPPYDHRDLWTCFYAARKLCGDLLEGLVLGPEYLIPLERKEEYFIATAPEGAFKPGHEYWLSLHTEKSDAVAASMDQHLKLSSSSRISTLISLAVPGVGLTYSEDPPSGMPLDPSASYFRIDRTSTQWLEIEKTRTISLYWPEAPDDLVVEIAVVRA